MKLRAASSMPILLLLAFVCASVRADQWALPTKKKYYSADKKYCLEVIPKQLESQLKYFRDKVEGRPDAGGVKGAKDNHAKAIFSVLEGNGYSKKSEFPLVNEVSPVGALVSGDGNHVVTFDNWHNVGYGDNVVVIYRSDGTLVKKFGLADLFTRSDMRHFPMSASSIWWGAGHYIDDTKGILHLKAGPQDGQRELTIELATGRRLEPMTNLFPERAVAQEPSGTPQPQIQFDAVLESKVEIVTAEAPDNPLPGKPSCASPNGNFDTAGALRISSDQLRSKAKSLARPPYPPIARAQRISSRVIVELLVSKSGDVICARTLEGNPLLLPVALQAARTWKFEPLETSDEVSAVVGTLAVHFKLQ
jgi:TonB family protein